MDFFEKEALLSLKELGINPYDTVFYKSGPLSPAKPLSTYFKKEIQKGEDIDSLALALAEKKPHNFFVCRLLLTDGLYVFSPPEQLAAVTDSPDDGSIPENSKSQFKPPRSIAKHISRTQNKLLAINNSQMRKLMEQARKNLDFIQRVNSELFFKNSFYQGKRIATEELFRFYGTPPYNQVIDLSPNTDKAPFIALYAMTFYACSPLDLFTVDGIFSLQPERHSDNAKKTAGNSVFNLILRNDKNEIEKTLIQMGEALTDIQPLRVNVNDAVMLSKNYTLFMGLSEMSRVFLRFVQSAEVSDVSESALEAAREFANYARLVNLCEAISVIADDEDYHETNAYKACEDLF